MQVDAVLRRQRDADAGVGGDLVAEALIGARINSKMRAGEILDVGFAR